MDYNKVALTGRLTRDPEVRYTERQSKLFFHYSL